MKNFLLMVVSLRSLEEMCRKEIDNEDS